MSDDMFYARVCQERDDLRAELAAAKAKMQEGENDCRFCRDLEGGSKYPCTCGWTYGALALAYGNAIQERDRLAADNARLRKALEEIAALAEEDISDLTGVAGQMVCFFCGHIPHEEKCPHPIATAALAATPAQSLAAHDAALLREVANLIRQTTPEPIEGHPDSFGTHEGRMYAIEQIESEADRIEQEAQRG